VTVGKGLWRAEPLILASRSEARRRLLASAGIPVRVEPADIDERAVAAAHGKGAGPREVASILARAKALAVPQDNASGALGADQTLALGSRLFTKPVSLAAAREQLAMLGGCTHELHSAVAVVQAGAMVFETVTTARLTMRPLSDEFIESYLASAGETVMASVGTYQLEDLGVQLFERIEGDYFTILGLPLLPLLAYFRRSGLLAN
jgi:septum formation protein